MLAALPVAALVALGAAQAPLHAGGPGGPALHGRATGLAASDKAATDAGEARETVMRVEELTVGDVPVRLYRPGEGRVPAIVYMPGGGGEGALDHRDALLRRLANRCHCVILAVGDRSASASASGRAARIHDAHAVLRWAADGARSLEIEPDKFVVAGDSVGATLAARLALRARNGRGPKIIYQALFYPAADLSSATAHDRRQPAVPRANDPGVELLDADLRGLPPAFIAIAGLEGHGSDGLALAARLEAAGVPTEARRYAGTSADSWPTAGQGTAMHQLVDDVAARLQKTFGYVE